MNFAVVKWQSMESLKGMNTFTSRCTMQQNIDKYTNLQAEQHKLYWFSQLQKEISQD